MRIYSKEHRTQASSRTLTERSAALLRIAGRLKQPAAPRRRRLKRLANTISEPSTCEHILHPPEDAKPPLLKQRGDLALVETIGEKK